MTDLRHSLAVWMLVAATAGCGGKEAATVDSSNGELEEPRRKGPPYVGAPLTAAGTITGSVTLGEPVAAANAGSAQPAAPAAAPAPATPTGTCAARPAAGEAVVYLEDIARGRPLPAETPRRYELSAGLCALTPRVLVAAAGATLNLSNSVGTVHHVSFTFEGMKQPLLRVPFSDVGQVVPTEKVLAVPGVVTVTSDQGPSAMAQILVLEHPYAVETRNGQFTLDSVPPGSYSLVAITGGTRKEAKVTVAAGNTVTVNLP